MNETNIAEALSEAQGVKGPGSDDPKKLSLDALALLVNTKRVRDLEDRAKAQYQELKNRQAEVRFLHKLLKVVNASTDSKGGFSASSNEELKTLLREADAMGVHIPEGKTSFTKEEKERLVDNVRLTCEDLNLQNEMQIQTITRLTHERYEAFQLARAILKPLNDDKVNKARAIAGR